MDRPTQITFLHMDVSPAVEARIREEVPALEHYFNRITLPRGRRGPASASSAGQGGHINIDLRVPGREIVVNHEPSLPSALTHGEEEESQKHLETQPDHKDIFVSIRDAFAAARRQLEDFARVLRGDTKHHVENAKD